MHIQTVDRVNIFNIFDDLPYTTCSTNDLFCLFYPICLKLFHSMHDSNEKDLSNIHLAESIELYIYLILKRIESNTENSIVLISFLFR